MRPGLRLFAQIVRRRLGAEQKQFVFQEWLGHDGRVTGRIVKDRGVDASQE